MQENARIAKALEKNLPQDKWKFLYEYARKSLDEDIENFQKVDNKASKFLTLVTAVFGVFAAIIPWIFENQFPPNGFLAWALYFVVGLAFLALISSWSLLFRTIKLAKAPRMPLNDQIEDLFFDSDLTNIYYKLTKACRKALENNRELVGEKGKLINLAYRDIAYSAWLVAISALLVAFVKLNEDIKMPEKDQTQQQSTQTQERPNQPDRDTTAPDIEYVFNSYDPQKEEGKQIITEKKGK